jgi:hypothetical protein
VARQHIAQALEQLDDAIREIRDYAFTARGYGAPPDPAPSNDDQ